MIRGQDVAEGEPFPGVKTRNLIAQATGSGAITLGTLRLPPGGTIPSHRHKVEEATYILQGSGTAIVGAATYRFEAGAALLAPAGVYHQVHNDGEQEILMVYAFPAVNIEREMDASQ